MSSSMKSMSVRLGQNVVAARTAAHMTQQELAEAAQVSRATIAEVERGLGDPRLSTLFALAEALGTSPMMLLMEKETLEVASKIGAATAAMNLSSESVERMRLWIKEDSSKGFQQAAKEGVRALGVGGKAAVGAAIGSAILPGMGTLVGAALGGLLGEKIADKVRQAAAEASDKSDKNNSV